MMSMGDPGGPGGPMSAGIVPGNPGNLRNNGSPDDLKVQFMTREGLYKLMTLSEYSRPNRVSSYSVPGGPNAGPGGPGNVSGGPPPVRVSFSREFPGGPNKSVEQKIVFNYGREIFVYPYRGVRKAADLTKPVDKRIYKGTCPTCHDFGSVFSSSNVSSNSSPGSSKNSMTTNTRDASTTTTMTTNHSSSSSCGVTVGGIEQASKMSDEVTPLLVGFTQGQIQLVDPVRKELSKLFNEERLIEKSRVTCIKWIPNSPNLFLVSFNSGNLYVFNHELLCSPTVPAYQTFKQGEGFSIFTCKAKSTRNPLYKWTVGHGAVNQFAFSPCGLFLAVVSQDGYLRIFNYHSMELIGMTRSYFGGVTCVAWSPDGKLIATGGEDDLITIYSKSENRILLRGQGHRSWVSMVSFDQYNISHGDVPDGLDFSGSDEEGSLSSSTTIPNGRPFYSNSQHIADSSNNRTNDSSFTSSSNNQESKCDRVTCYRLGSVGEDACLCLWDLTEDLLKMSTITSLSSSASLATAGSSQDNNTSKKGSQQSGKSQEANGSSTSNHTTTTTSKETSSTSSSTSLTQRLANLNFGADRNKEHKRNFSLTGRNSDKDKGAGGSSSCSSNTLLSHTNSSTSSLLNTNSSSSSTMQTNSSSTNTVLVPPGIINMGTLPEYVKLGSPQCPKITEVPLIEPVVCKRISNERLTSLTFLEDCFVTSCQDGIVSTWARPGRLSGNYGSLNCPGSPQQNSSSGGGTIV